MATTNAPMETGIFYNRYDADEAVRLLHELGYRDDEISVMMSDRTRVNEFAPEGGTKVPEGAGAGVMIGGTLGARTRRRHRRSTGGCRCSRAACARDRPRVAAGRDHGRRHAEWRVRCWFARVEINQR
jgi:hypothetical protein